ncbi:Na+/H+ antiporter subunit D [Agromyces protaetiae]|uniref:Na+/H+ antiporter subunit D n=2 Tax=Agromyces protaetiae TaxID=2509455 RepID=A0A4P6FLF1_9MICO|nr:Na+/H+ antiporter subunit D [Agromyces protaetiae]
MASLAQALVPLVVLLPLLGAATTLILGRQRRAQMAVSASVLGAVLVIAVTLLMTVDASGEGVVVAVGAWQPPWGIVLVVDRLSAIMLVVSAVVLLGVLVYAVGQGIADQHRETPVSIFHPSYLILSAGVFNAFIAGDLFNLYVGFEILLSASYVLLTLGGTGERIRAGVTYIIVSLVSSLFFLSAIALIYGATGTANIAQLSARIADLPDGVQLILHVLLLLAFGIKAAVFPLSFWLPDSYPTAPAPVTAVFAGLLTKVGVYAIIRTETIIFSDSDLSTLLLVIGGLTMLVGILGALTQADIKRLLSFTLVSHIGYMIFGIGLATPLGLAATIFYVVHHITVQTALFLTTGLIERIGGSTSINRLAGLLRASPLLGVLFFIPALNLGGIPPLSGFLGKLGLFVAGGEAASSPDVPGGHAWLIWAVIGAGAATSLITLYALTRFWNMAFWRGRDELDGYHSVLLGSVQEWPGADASASTPNDTEASGPVATATRTATRSAPVLMLAATAALVAVTLLLTVFAGPLFDLAGRAAAGLVDPVVYIGLVFPGGIR